VVLLAALGNQDAFEIPLTPPQQIRRTMTTLNCYACHARDRRGSPTGLRREYFTATRPADRVPPSLQGVGSRLTHDEIAAVLTQGKTKREGMATRMPQFGKENLARLTEAFVAADAGK
jgi:hypothetical protein